MSHIVNNLHFKNLKLHMSVICMYMHMCIYNYKIDVRS